MTYKAEYADIAPENSIAKIYANVHSEISVSTAQFTVASAAVRYGYAFAGWNTEEDGTGKMYKEGDILETEKDMTLYAVFKRPLHAYFYSGSAGEKEEQIVEIPENATSGTTRTPELKNLEIPENARSKKELVAASWIPVGWELQKDGYGGEIQAGEEVTLTDDTSYYGIYRKDVVLTYVAEGIEGFPKEEAGECRANVHEELTKLLAEFTVASEPVRPGSVFTGWNTKPDGSGEVYGEGDVLETEEDVTLYAIFRKELTVNFYSGSEGSIDSRIVSISGDAVSGRLKMPELREIDGWTRLGWSTDISRYEGEIAAESMQTITEDTEYYGIYEKDVTVTFEGEGGGGVKETKPCRANVHNKISYDSPSFLLPALVREGYTFLGWNTKPDSNGITYPAGSEQEFDQDIVLYASWKVNKASYRVEHYMQEIEGHGYILVESETEELSGAVGDMVEAQAKNFPGFTENTEHTSRCASGNVKADGSLTLSMYYDRNVYHVVFDLNGGYGITPEPKSVRYGGLLQTVDAPERAGYNFKGWYLDKAGSKGKQWDFARTVEENISSESVTLYAKWADEIAPVLEKASYGKGHKDLFSWILHKNRLKITVPITEEGSGVKQAEYVLIPEKTTKETVQTGSIYAPVYGAIGMSLGALNAGGKISRSMKGRARVTTMNGKTVAEFTISEDFKGTIAMTGSDWAGNVSAKKMLTAEGGGVIVEDNAPDICFTPDDRGQYGNESVVGVEIRDNADGNITGGIASVSYQMDDGEETFLPEKIFRKGIVESYKFNLKISGAGSHKLHVNAVDNAGNSSSRQVTVDIRGNMAPLGAEPKTGDTSHVEIYATASMIAGFSYLLLYFREHGMTEEKKEELVSRLVGWAKGKGGIQRMAALVMIFLLLAYYHSIGRNVDGEWKEVCRLNTSNIK